MAYELRLSCPSSASTMSIVGLLSVAIPTSCLLLPNDPVRFLVYIAFGRNLDSTRHFASAIDRATACCFLDIQLTMFTLNLINPPVIDLWSGLSLAQFEFVYTVALSSSVFSKIVSYTRFFLKDYFVLPLVCLLVCVAAGVPSLRTTYAISGSVQSAKNLSSPTSCWKLVFACGCLVSSSVEGWYSIYFWVWGPFWCIMPSLHLSRFFLPAVAVKALCLLLLHSQSSIPDLCVAYLIALHCIFSWGRCRLTPWIVALRPLLEGCLLLCI